MINVSVCLGVFVCPRSYLRKYTSDLHQNFCACYLWPMLPMAVAHRSSSGGVVIRYVLPVLWMSSYLLYLFFIMAYRWRLRATHAAFTRDCWRCTIKCVLLITSCGDRWRALITDARHVTFTAVGRMRLCTCCMSLAPADSGSLCIPLRPKYQTKSLQLSLRQM